MKVGSLGMGGGKNHYGPTDPYLSVVRRALERLRVSWTYGAQTRGC